MKLSHALFALAAVLAAFGCGGSSGGSSSSGAQARLFITDDMGNYDHVFVTVKEVDLVGASKTQVIYSSPTGETIDLASLHSGGTPMYSFLGLHQVAPGTYTQLKFVLADKVTVFPQGATTGDVKTLTGATNGIATLTANMGPTPITGIADVVADFPLSNWTGVGQSITGVVVIANAPDLGDSSHRKPRQYEGQISGLGGTAPNFTFNLSQHAGSVVHAATTVDTVIYNNDGSPNPMLANGDRIHAQGTFDPATSLLTLTSIRIQHSSGDEDTPEIHGVVNTVGSGNFTLNIHECDDVSPNSTTITVMPSATAVFMDSDGSSLTSAEFFALLAPGVKVEAEGSFDESTSTLTADKLKIDQDGEDGDGGGDGQGHKVSVAGPPSSPIEAAGTVDIAVTDWHGASLHSGQTIHVTTSGDSTFQSPSGDPLTSAQFFAAVATAPGVKVQGSLSNTTIAAKKLRLQGN